MRSKTEISYNQNQLMGGGYPIYGQPMMNGLQNGLMMGQPVTAGANPNFKPLNLPPIVFGMPAMNGGRQS